MQRRDVADLTTNPSVIALRVVPPSLERRFNMANGTFNQQMIIGHMGDEPRLFRDSKGDKVLVIANFSLATTEKYRDKAGNPKEETTWHRCVAFGGLAEVVEKYAHKGDKIHVVGRTRHSTYSKDGVDIHYTEVVVTELNLLEKAPKTGERAAAPPAPSAADFNDPSNPFFVPPTGSSREPVEA